MNNQIKTSNTITIVISASGLVFALRMLYVSMNKDIAMAYAILFVVCLLILITSIVIKDINDKFE